MQPYLQAFFCKTILFSIFCTLGLTPQYAKAQGGCTNSYRVWTDCDADGQQGVFENGLQGVNVTLYDANCVPLQQVTTDAQGLYSFGNLTASKAYYAVFGNTQYANGVLNVNDKSHNLSLANTGAETIDSDAQLGGASPTCANGKPYIAFTTNASGCADGFLDAGFIRLDFQLNNINVVHETCGGNRNGSITFDLANIVGGFSTLITGNTRMGGVTAYNNLAPGTYNVEIRSNAPTCNTFYSSTLTINAGPTISAPTVTDDRVCRYESNSQNGGLKATATNCLNGNPPTITWWTSQTGGSKVFTGAIFNPITQNWINTSVVGTASFWAQSECNGCVSPRVKANFVIRPRPEPAITGEKFPCPSSTMTYTTPSVSGSTYVWSLPDGGGTIISTNNNSVTILWNNTPGTGPFNVHVVETSKDGCSQSNDFKASIKSVQLTCIGSFNASVDEQCHFVMSHSSLLSASFIGSETYTIQLQTPEGLLLEQGIGQVSLDGVSNSGSPYQLAGKQFIYNIAEACVGTRCWGYINFEDKTAPTITCPADVTLACSQVEVGQTPLPTLSGSPIVSDCSKTTTSYYDEVREADCQQPFTTLPSDWVALKAATFPTTRDIVKIILRTFIVKDDGNNSVSCKQYIFIRKGYVQNVICPADVVIDCQNYVGETSTTPSVTNMPILDVDGDLTTTYDRYPIGTGSCKMQVTHTDQKIVLCTNSFKLLRDWKIYDPCAVDDPRTVTDERVKQCKQVIVVSDKTPPSVATSFTQYYVKNGSTVARDTVVVFDGYEDSNNNSIAGTIQPVWALGNNTVCGGKMQLTFRMKDEGCTKTQVIIRSDDSRVIMAAGYPRFDATTGETVAVFEASYTEFGDYNITFTASDDCGFVRAKKTFSIKIRDNVKPNVVCKTYTTTTLTNNGSVRVLAESFNNVSTDNCGIEKIEVRRTTSCQNPADTLFKPYVDFNCCDANTTSLVVLRVWDYYGNFSECMVNIRIDDKIGPTCTAPANTTISCVDFSFSSLQNFGKPNFRDNCSIKDTVYTEVERLDNCKVGTLLRKWVISDAGGLKDSCQQLITIRGKSDFTVDFPDDMFVSCFDAVPTKEQTRIALLSNGKDKDGHIINDGCGVLAVEVTDDTLTATPDACYKILRKISVIDWCKYNPNNYDINTSCYGKPVCGDVHTNSNWAAQNIPSWQFLERPACTDPSERRFRDADGLGGLTQPYSPYCFSDGLICYTQVIKVVDDIAPVFTYCPKDTIIKSFVSLGCVDNAKLTVTASDLCADGQSTNVSYLLFKWLIIDSTTNLTIKAGYGNTLSATFDYSRSYYVVWSVEDRCGNRTYCRQKVKVVDGKVPSILCKDINAEIANMPGVGGMVQVLATDLLPTSAADNCTSSSYLLEHLRIEKDVTSSGRYPSVSNASLTFTCEEARIAVPIRVWTIDQAGNANYCLSKINIQDNLNTCADYNLTIITGSVKTENDVSIAGVNLAANQNGANMGTAFSNSIGNYSIGNMMKGNNYSVSAALQDLPLNGVTTFDVALMSKHILGIEPLNSPYKIIAADINRDGDISGLDLLNTRRMILRLQTAFPNSTPSWRFVDKRYRFADPTNPLSEDFPEVVNFTDMPRGSQADFVGIKVGDVNGSATVAAATTIRGAHKALIFNTEDIALEAGKEYKVIFKSNDFNAQAYQFTLNHTEGVEIVRIENGLFPDMTSGNFGQFKTALTTTWNGNFEGKADDIFTIVLRAKQNTQLSDVLTIGSNLTTAEAYSKEGEVMDVKLVFAPDPKGGKGGNTEGGSFALYQNEPNPFTNQTKISFNLPTESNVRLTVYDVTGRILKTINDKFVKGYNEVPLTKEDIQATGILYYRLDTPTHSATKKMIVL